MRYSREARDDYAERYAAREKNSRADLWRIELVVAKAAAL